MSKTNLILTLLILALATSSTLQWSKCKSLECKSCSNKGCIKCTNFWSDWNYECKLPADLTLSNCLHEISVPAILPATTPTKKCTVCKQGFSLDQTGVNCSALGSSDCYAGEWSTVSLFFKIQILIFQVNGVTKFRCLNCINGKMAGPEGDCTLPVGTNFGNCIGTNMTYAAAGATQTCSHCDYGYSLDPDNNCKLQCAEGCLKCDQNHVCIECDHYRNWWSTSPHNCTHPTFDYYYPNYRAGILGGLAFFVVVVSTLFVF